MKGTARTIVLTDKGLQAVREMRRYGAVPDIPANGWAPERQPRATPPAPAPEPVAEETAREKVIESAKGRDIFLSPAFVLPGDRLLRIVAGERLHLGTVTHVDRVGAAYRIFLADGGWKTCGEHAAVLVAPRDQ